MPGHAAQLLQPQMPVAQIYYTENNETRSVLITIYGMTVKSAGSTHFYTLETPRIDFAVQLCWEYHNLLLEFIVNIVAADFSVKMCQSLENSAGFYDLGMVWYSRV